MLNAETKRRIDNARDILVGKVPDPKTQVEQITFAMIYKFMDDMDQISVKLGGKASFFNNGYEGFAWSKLMDKKLSGSQRLDLYVRALEGMSNNPLSPNCLRCSRAPFALPRQRNPEPVSEGDERLHLRPQRRSGRRLRYLLPSSPPRAKQAISHAAPHHRLHR